MLIAALFIKDEKWKQPKRLSIDEWLNKIWSEEKNNKITNLAANNSAEQLEEFLKLLVKPCSKYLPTCLFSMSLQARGGFTPFLTDASPVLTLLHRNTTPPH